MSGYRIAGQRAIRIDMLERLADMLRNEDSRGGFEAKADMLSITGTTLEQFADLMAGLGYKAEKGEREKVKATDAAAAAPATSADAAPVEGDAAAESEQASENSAEVAAQDAAAADAEAAPEVEVFYTFTWSRAPRANARGPRSDAPRSKGKPGGKPKGGARGKKAPRDDKAKSFSSRPPKQEKKIDPDNPFAAALMGLKDNT